MAERLEVQVGADIKQLEKGLEQSKKKLKDFEKATKGVGGKVNSNLSKGAKGMNSFGKSTANAVPAVTEFSRVIQDAPFGIQGVANNITQLTQQFGNLTQKTGSSKQALKLMLSTLSGPAGILLAVSAVTSLLVTFGDELFATSKDAEKLTDAIKDLNGQARQEINNLKTLLSAAQDENNTREVRLRALNKLNSEYGKYLPNLTLENVRSKEVTKSINLLSDALLRQAKIKGLQNRLSELFAKRFEIENKSIEKQLTFFDQLAIGFKGYVKGVGQLDLAKASTEGVNTALENQAKALREVDVEIKKITSSYKSLLTEDLTVGGVETESINTETPKLKQALELQRVNIVSGINKITEATELTGKKFKQAYGSAFTINTQELGQRLTEDQQFILDSLTNFNNAASQIINNNITRTFSGIGDAIGNALSGAGNLSNNLSKALLGSMGALLTQLGQMAIAVGVGLNKIKLALQSLNPAVAIAAGIGLVALGKFFSNKSASIGNQIGGGSSGGGSVSGGVSGGTTRSFGSSSSFTGSNQGFSNVVFEIKGTDLVGVLSRTLERNRNLGGSLSIG